MPTTFDNVLDAALDLTRRGFFVLPLVAGSKSPYHKVWQTTRLTLEDIPAHFDTGRDPNLGVMLGVSGVPGSLPAMIDVDVDDPVLNRRVRCAVGGDPPIKFGQKGGGIFVRCPQIFKNRALNFKDVTNRNVRGVDLMCERDQTVVPPSVHPNTGRPYTWISRTSLHDHTPDTLPLVDQYVFDEIELAVKNPGSSLFLINDMVNSTPDTPGDAHNSVLSAVAVMVSRGWSDEAIWRRILLATEFTSYDPPPHWQDVVLRMADDARSKGMENQARRAGSKNDYVAAAVWMIDQWRGPDSVRNLDGQAAAYEDGRWTTLSDDDIRHVVAVSCPVKMNGHSHWEATCRTVLDMAPRLPKVESELVCMANGTMDISSGELRPWSRDDYLITSVPFEYDASAECPAYDSFIRSTFEGDETEKCVALYEEFAAYSLIRGTKHQKFLVLKGEPGSGKSVALHVLRMLHHPRNVSAVAADKFGDEKYTAHMVGKLLNVTGEVKAFSNLADDFIKQVTAHDPVTARPLYAAPRDVILPTRFVIACNAMFRVRDTSGAVERRMMVIPCPHRVPEEEQDPDLVRKLERELPGIFNRVLAAYARLRDRNRFDIPDSSRGAVEEFTSENNHVIQWYRERTLEGQRDVFPDAPAPAPRMTSVSELFQDYSEWSKFHNFQPISSITFGMRLTAAAPQAAPANVRVGNSVVRSRPLTLVQQAGF